MATLSTSHRAFWPGTVAALAAAHAGRWSRDGDWNDRFFEGDDVAAGATGGAFGHVHPIPDHDHDGVAHTHDVWSDETEANTLDHTTDGDPTAMSAGTHEHPAEAMDPATINYSRVVDTDSSQTGASPPYFTVIVIEPDDALQQVPDDAVFLWDQGTIPAGHQFCNGDNGAPDMRDRFMRGAGLGDDGGDTGGSLTHVHTWAHVHAEVVHDHDATLMAAASATVVTKDGLAGFPKNILSVVHHGCSLAAMSPGVDSEAQPYHLGQNLPEYTRLAALQNQTGGDSLVKGMILGWAGATVDIPTDWLPLDGTNDTINTVDLQVWLVNNTTQIGDEGPGGGGVEAHRHTSDGTHVHTIPAHGDSTPANTHVESVDNRPALKRAATPFPDDVATSHVHNWTVGDTVATMQATDAGNTATADGRQPWKAMVFVKYWPTMPAATVKLLGGTVLGSAAIAAA